MGAEPVKATVTDTDCARHNGLSLVVRELPHMFVFLVRKAGVAECVRCQHHVHLCSSPSLGVDTLVMMPAVASEMLCQCR